MRTDIMARIAECVTERDRLERDLLVVNARLQAYQDVLELLPPVQSANETHAARPPNGEEVRRRGISAHWKTALSNLKDSGFSVFTIDNVLEALSNATGFDHPRGNVRSQLAVYVRRGILERVGQGHFRVTPTGDATLRSAVTEDDALTPPDDEPCHNVASADVADIEIQTIKEMLG